MANLTPNSINQNDKQSRHDSVASTLLKKRPNEPNEAKYNLDIPGASIARPLTNDRHSNDIVKQTEPIWKEPIENIVLDTDYGKHNK